MGWNPNVRPQFFNPEQYAVNMKDQGKGDDYSEAMKYENFMLDVEKSPRFNGKIFGTQKVDHQNKAANVFSVDPSQLHLMPEFAMQPFAFNMTPKSDGSSQ